MDATKKFATFFLEARPNYRSECNHWPETITDDYKITFHLPDLRNVLNAVFA